MGGKKMRNLSYKKVDEHKSGVLFLILSLHSLRKKKWEKMFYTHYYCEY